jgi:hypothetical protein
MAQVVGPLPSKCKAHSSNPSTNHSTVKIKNKSTKMLEKTFSAVINE